MTPHRSSSFSSHRSDEHGLRVSVSMEPYEEPERPTLPFGGVASQPRGTATVGPAPNVSDVLRTAHLNRTAPPPLPEYQVLGQRKAVGVRGRMVWAGLKAFGALEFMGEVLADFFGLYNSKYQHVIDAYDRNKRELEAERAERAALRREAREAQSKEAEENEPAHLRAERNRQEQAAAKQAKESASGDATSSTNTMVSDDLPEIDVLPAEDHVQDQSV